MSRVFYTDHLSKLVATLLPQTGWDIKMRSGRGIEGCGALSAVCTSCTYMGRKGAQVQVMTGSGSGWQAQVQVRTGSGSGLGWQAQVQVRTGSGSGSEWQAQVQVRTGSGSGSGWQAQVQVRTGSGSEWQVRERWVQVSSISSTYIPSVAQPDLFCRFMTQGSCGFGVNTVVARKPDGFLCHSSALSMRPFGALSSTASSVPSGLVKAR